MPTDSILLNILLMIRKMMLTHHLMRIPLSKWRIAFKTKRLMIWKTGIPIIAWKPESSMKIILEILISAHDI